MLTTIETSELKIELSRLARQLDDGLARLLTWGQTDSDLDRAAITTAANATELALDCLCSASRGPTCPVKIGPGKGAYCEQCWRHFQPAKVQRGIAVICPECSRNNAALYASQQYE